MTSELKPCPFCSSGRINCFINAYDNVEHECKDCGCRVEGDGDNWNTRATPPADPLERLVRFGWNSEDQVVDPMEDGEYVLHSEAAKIVAAKDAEIERLKDENTIIFETYLDKHNKNVTLKDELAQIKESRND